MKDQSNAGYSPWFLGTVALFITCLITANIIAVKFVNLFGVVLTAGVIIFPISYIVGDVLTEVYGYRQARRVIWLGFACNLIATTAIVVTQYLPSPAFWDGQAAYVRILGSAPRVLVASFLAYLVGEFANSIILAKLKVATQGRWLWLRTISSTLVGQGLDSVVFMSVAFLGTIPTSGIAAAIIAQWASKSLYEVVATPLTYAVVGFLKRKEGVDVYDHDTDFNPLLIAEGN